MDYCLNVFEKKLDDLIKISINERYANGDGVLFLNFVSNEKLDVFFHPLFDKKNDCLNNVFSKKYIDFYLDKFKNAPKSLLYFLIIEGEDELNMEVDLDKESGYTHSLLEKTELKTSK